VLAACPAVHLDGKDPAALTLGRAVDVGAGRWGLPRPALAARGPRAARAQRDPSPPW